MSPVTKTSWTQMSRPATSVVVVIVSALAAITLIASLRGDSQSTGDSLDEDTRGPERLPGVSLRDIDGGVDYYEQFEQSLPSSPDYFPLGVWFESVRNTGDTAQDRSVGLNTYVELTADSDLSVARDAGMFALPSFEAPEANGFMVTDEPDMWAGPGSAPWTGNDPGKDICVPVDALCGFTVMETLLQRAPPGVPTYVNYGKGVAFWNSDEDAARFVNYTDIVSADTYWFTDPNICGPIEGGRGPGEDGEEMSVADCRLAANYGWTVQRVRDLVSPEGSKPVWNFVEVGHPFEADSSPTITGEQIRAAVWAGIIHGARGVIYFNHNFGGDCFSQHVLRDACGDAVRPAVTAVNAQITELAPVLNAPFVEGMVTVQGPADVAVKLHDDTFTLIAGSTDPASHEVTFTSKCTTADTATVLGEDRTLPVVEGAFTDTFVDGNAVHLYRLDGTTCGVQ